MVTGIEHIGLYAKDSKALADWYIDMFGCTIAYENTSKGTYFVAFADKSMIEICKASDDMLSNPALTDAGLRHIALTVSDFDAVVAKLKGADTEIVADEVTSSSGVKTIFFRDIAGNILHLISRPEPLI
ncbi:MAG: VOC family protein [Clostridia bacterium]|nr:VOC family protein [Clostridia bacterium]